MFRLLSWHGSAKDCAFCMKHATNSGLFALFWRDPAAIPDPAGYYVNQERAGLPPKILAGNKKSLFLDALKFRKAEKSPKNKKDQRHDSLAFVLRAL